MNKTISSRLAISLLIAIAIVFLTYLWFENRSLQNEALPPVSNAQMIRNNQKTACKNHAYKGNVTVKVWPVKKGDKTVLKIADDDLVKMPSKKITEIALVDSNSQLTKSLNKASVKNPAEITLTGVAIPCHGTALACLSYKDGIFRPYL